MLLFLADTQGKSAPEILLGWFNQIEESFWTNPVGVMTKLGRPSEPARTKYLSVTKLLLMSFLLSSVIY